MAWAALASWMVATVLIAIRLGKATRIPEEWSCHACGFDMRDGEQSLDRCPECGAERSTFKDLEQARRRREANLGIILILLLWPAILFVASLLP